MKFHLRVLTLTVLLGSALLLTGCHRSGNTGLAQVKGRNLTAMVISDDHVIAPSLHDNGEAFDTYAGNDAGADLKYSATIFKAFIAKALATKPDIVIMSGDITNNGEKASHEYVAKQLKRLTKQGIRVYVVPGNHDLNNPITRRFKGKKQYEAEAIDAAQFKQIYAKAGYDAAVDHDSHSLSYLVKPSKKTWFLMLNSAIYKSNYQQGSSTVGGGLPDGTLDWVAKVGREAKKQHATLIPVLHHNIMNHTMISQGYTIGYADQVREVFSKANVKLTLTGHIHAQSIKHKMINGQEITDIASGALIMGQHYYGTLKIDQHTGQAQYHATPLDVSTYIQQHQGTKAVKAYQKYDHDVLYASGYNAALSSLYEDQDENHYSTKKIKTLATGMGEANIAMFRGTPVKITPAITAWEKMPDSVHLKQFILKTKNLHGNLKWSGDVR
ncbi:metallophosphoesterase [Lactiplantibacillus sp. WILCCON 0030]|uniref:Metallophosphoesterase n=1 Tax=Lactiplantibacillus brownii TaxID=3069269 RepID=A0ABU1A9E7_9LACO|nr:metallophosphoesterase [Lactiplantibacillus brownii]MDQ7937559.1 metallophosphoesterase [Lactiplantibacillus brownii]